MMLGYRGRRYRHSEDLADHQRQLRSLDIVAWSQLFGGQLDCCISCRGQGPLLIAAKQHGSQPPAFPVGEHADQPRRKVVGEEHHAASFAAR